VLHQPSNNVMELTVVFTSLVLFSATQGMQLLSLFLRGSDGTIDIAVDGQAASFDHAS